MKSDIKTKGFVLKAQPYGESHKIITLFSYDLGKIKIVAHGIRKTKSKYGSTFELLNEVDLNISLNKNSDLYKIHDFNIIQSQHAIREKYEHLSHLFELSDFILQFTQDENEDREMYHLVSQGLNRIQLSLTNIFPIVKSLELKSLVQLGFLHSLKYCSHCGAELLNSKVYISARSGWIFCDECKNQYSDDEISKASYKILLNLLEFNLDVTARIIIDEDSKKLLNHYFEKLFYSLINKKLRSL